MIGFLSMFEIKEITDKSEWDNFVSSGKPHTFLQSWNWGAFNKAMGHKVWYLGLFYKGFLTGVALILKISARRGTFLFCPHGPIMKQPEFRILIDYLKELAKKEDCSFIRISPILIKTPGNEKLFKDLGFRPAPIHAHAELVWMLDVTPKEEQLLADMRKTTRYLIRKAQSEDVEIIKSTNPEHLEIFNKLYKETADRQSFTAYSENYLRGEFTAFRNDNQVMIFLAKYNNEFVSGAMIIFYDDSAFYHQGASSLKYPKVPAAYLLQWEVIREAKAKGLHYYNFWGISPENKPRHPWAGLTLFKKGFGGFDEEYVPAHDLALEPSSYWLTYLIEKIRKTKRGL